MILDDKQSKMNDVMDHKLVIHVIILAEQGASQLICTSTKITNYMTFLMKVNSDKNVKQITMLENKTFAYRRITICKIKLNIALHCFNCCCCNSEPFSALLFSLFFFNSFFLFFNSKVWSKLLAY